jgi:hypothetical protein
MTESSRLPLAFSALGGRKALADFDRRGMASDAGAVLLREVDRRIGLIDVGGPVRFRLSTTRERHDSRQG